MIVHSYYEVDGETRKTKIADSTLGPYGSPDQSLFYQCNNVQSISFDEDIDTSEITNMAYMFYGCSALTSLDISHFDTSNVTEMRSMFNCCPNLTVIYVDANKWNISNAITYTMFDNCGTDHVTYK